MQKHKIKHRVEPRLSVCPAAPADRNTQALVFSSESHVLLPDRIIPIFLIHRPENNIPYATVEEELIGEFVKYSIRDGKEINFLRRESEAGQKCCTFQHWVYQKTSGCLLVTDMQGERTAPPGSGDAGGSGAFLRVGGRREEGGEVKRRGLLSTNKHLLPKMLFMSSWK